MRGLDVRRGLLCRRFLFCLRAFFRTWLGRFLRHLPGILRPMNHTNDPISEATLFSAVITPHRSLSRSGFLLVMLLIGGVSFVGGIVFYAIGAWPIVGFLGLDVLLLYWAFR